VIANVDAEMKIAGAFMLEQGVIALHSELVAADFTSEPCRRVVAAARELLQQGSPVHPASVGQRLMEQGFFEAVGGAAALRDMCDESYPSATDDAVRRVRLLGARRRAAETLQQLLMESMTYPDSMDEGEDWLARLSTRVASAADGICTGSGPRHIRDLAADAMADIRLRAEAKTLPGVVHGVPGLVEFLPTLTPTDLITIAARPGMGKSALVGQMTMAAARAGKVVLLFSLEMSSLQLVWRMVAKESRVPLSRLRSDVLHGPEQERTQRALANVAEHQIWVDDTSRLTAGQVRARTLQTKQRLESEGRQLGLVAVDYIGLMKGEKGLDRHLQISAMTKELKALAKEAVVPVIQLAQLNRKCEDRTDKRPLVSDLKDSGAIEEDSDIILFPFRPAYYDKAHTGGVEPAEIAVAKQRNGPTGVAHCAWEPGSLEFVEAVGGF
jgi:replicative DNA helicase